MAQLISMVEQLFLLSLLKIVALFGSVVIKLKLFKLCLFYYIIFLIFLMLSKIKYLKNFLQYDNLKIY